MVANQHEQRNTMGAIARRPENHGVQLLVKEEDLLRAILRRLIKKPPGFPLADIRKKHYYPNGELRTEMDEMTDRQCQHRMCAFSAVLKQQLSSMESDAKAQEQKHQMKLEVLGKKLKQLDFDNEVGQNQVHASTVVVLREHRQHLKTSVEVSIVR